MKARQIVPFLGDTPAGKGEPRVPALAVFQEPGYGGGEAGHVMSKKSVSGEHCFHTTTISGESLGSLTSVEGWPVL